MEVSVLQKTDEDDSVKRSYHIISCKPMELRRKLTWVAIYAKEAVVVRVIPCIRAFPDLVAFTSFSTELGEVKICLNAYTLKWWAAGMVKVKGLSELPKLEADFWKDHSMGPRDRKLDSHTPAMAIDHHGQPIRRRKASSAPWLGIGLNILKQRRYKIIRTHSESFQSKPAGQRRLPVTEWWKPLFSLTFRVRGGSKGASLGVIHSKTTPFKLFVSSDLAVEMPFWIYNMHETNLSTWNGLSDILDRPPTWTPRQRLPWGAQRGVGPSARAFETLDTLFWPCARRYVSKEKDEDKGNKLISYCFLLHLTVRLAHEE